MLNGKNALLALVDKTFVLGVDMLLLAIS